MKNDNVGDDSVFIAFWLPRRARKTFGHLDGLEYGLHMTVLSLRGVSNGDRQPILDAVEAVCNLTTPIECETSGIGIMDNERNTIVVNVTAMDGAKLYAELLDAIERRLCRKVDRDFDFFPHVTLRLDGNGSKVDIEDLRKFEWTADELSVQFEEGGEKNIMPLKGEG